MNKAILAVAMAVAAVVPAAAPALAEFRITQTLVPAADEPELAFDLWLEKTGETHPVAGLRLVVVTDTARGLTREAAKTLDVSLQFEADGWSWEVGPDGCQTPRDFGADFTREGYDRTQDFVCVIVGDGGNFAVRPRFDDKGVASSYEVTFRFAKEGVDGYSGLRVDGGPEAFQDNPQTFEPYYNGFSPREAGMKRTVVFVDRK